MPAADARNRLGLTHDPARRAFVAVFGATLLAFLAIGAALPVLPRYVHGPLNGSDFAVGVVVGAFAVTAVVGRPFAGGWSDSRGRRPVLITGALLAAVGGALYFLPFGVAGLIGARLILGIGDGFVFTAGAAWALDLAPPERRGQVIGLYGLAIWTGLTVGPLIGEGLLAAGGYDAVWVFAAAAPLAGALLATRIPEAPRSSEERSRGWFEPAAVRPGVALALANVGYATIASFIVLHLAERGVGSGAMVFTAFAATVVVARVAAGHLPDRIGPLRAAALFGGAEAAGLLVLAAASSLPVALAGGALAGFGFSLLFPSLALAVVERVDDDRRGVALGSLTSFFDVGMGLGAPLAGTIAAIGGYPAAFAAAAAFALAGVIVSATAPARA